MRTNLPPFPPQWFVDLVYAEDPIQLASGIAGATSGVVSFNLNNIFDPYVPAGGHQPLYRDQIAALYTNYIVHKVRVQISFQNASADGIFCVVQVAGFDFGTLGGQSFSRVSELPRTQVAQLSNTGSQVVTFDQSFNLWELADVKKSQYLNDLATYGSLVTGAPTAASLLNVTAGDIGGAVGTTVQVQVKLTYRVQFYGRGFPTQS